jgi:hypothetical protein
MQVENAKSAVSEESVEVEVVEVDVVAEAVVVVVGLVANSPTGPKSRWHCAV